MTSKALTITRIAELDAGTWRKFKCPNDVMVRPRTLMYGINGSGKTTLSRVFSSIQRNEMESALPDGATFKIKASDGSVITQDLQGNPFGMNLLVFNVDFIKRNFSWDECRADGIAYLGEDSVEGKKELDESIEALDSLKGDLKMLETESKDVKAAVDKLAKSIAENIRSIAGVDSYFPNYNARDIKKAYSNKVCDASMKLDEDQYRHCLQVIGQRRDYGAISELDVPSAELWEWFEASAQFLNKDFASTILDELADHSDALTHLGWLLNYHEERMLNECLLCGNTFSRERRDHLKVYFNTAWQSAQERCRKLIESGKVYANESQQLSNSTPHKEQIVEFERDQYIEAQEAFLSATNDINKRIQQFVSALEKWLENPTHCNVLSSELEMKSVNELSQEHNSTNRAIHVILERHNDALEQREEHWRSAFYNIEDHTLFEKNDEWMIANNKQKECENRLSAVRENINKKQEEITQLKNTLFSHEATTDLLNRFIWDYLGHKEIELTATDEGYRIIRSGRYPAVELSEGEKTAIAFCYFLTLLGAEGRKKEDLVVIIDDPVSSLDATARTQAFSVMTRETEDCAQVIVLTHNMEFMNIVKRRYGSMKKYEKWQGLIAFMQLECMCSDSWSERCTKLVNMHCLLVKYDSEYHYLFELVNRAAHDGERSHLFILPNVIRKMLEIFSMYGSPDKTEIAAALLERREKLKNIVDVAALERLVQRESHGDQDGMANLPDLSWDYAQPAAAEALKYIKEVASEHYCRMMKVCKRSTECTQETTENNESTVSVGEASEE